MKKTVRSYRSNGNSPRPHNPTVAARSMSTMN